MSGRSGKISPTRPPIRASSRARGALVGRAVGAFEHELAAVARATCSTARECRRTAPAAGRPGSVMRPARPYSVMPSDADAPVRALTILRRYSTAARSGNTGLHGGARHPPPARRHARVRVLARARRRRTADRAHARRRAARGRRDLRRRPVRAVRRQRPLPPLALASALAPAAAAGRPQHDLRVHRRLLHAGRDARAVGRDALGRADHGLGGRAARRRASAWPGSTRRGRCPRRRYVALGWVAVVAFPQLHSRAARPRRWC